MVAELDDAALVRAAQGGDRRAMDALLRHQYDRIYAVCRRITGNDADAADVSQNTLIAIVRALPRFDGRSSFSTWCYRIATNASLDELRRRRRHPTSSIDIDDQPVSLPDTKAVDALDLVVDRLALSQALERIPDDFRVPLVMRDVADMDYGEIAEDLAIPLGTVKSRIARGRALLTSNYLAAIGNQPGIDERPSFGS
ncbi:MAG TPA: sigma-70 family RNA polymerase sigma factor [Ilumatobacteraceae bacterium]|nr:sigma-70 family RNA polymerase sigma factor [Ilumatobacteraceae bacterium]